MIKAIRENAEMRGGAEAEEEHTTDPDLQSKGPPPGRMKETGTMSEAGVTRASLNNRGPAASLAQR